MSDLSAAEYNDLSDLLNARKFSVLKNYIFRLPDAKRSAAFSHVYSILNIPTMFGNKGIWLHVPSLSQGDTLTAHRFLLSVAKLLNHNAHEELYQFPSGFRLDGYFGQSIIYDFAPSEFEKLTPKSTDPYSAYKLYRWQTFSSHWNSHYVPSINEKDQSFLPHQSHRGETYPLDYKILCSHFFLFSRKQFLSAKRAWVSFQTNNCYV
ncbi:hypothetical protein P9112_010526 [Eukaryota sp. TZLM1-RC]